MLRALGQVELVEIPVPDIKEDQLLIKTGAATICTSDLNDIRANPFKIDLPVVIGHEAAGIVVAVGDAVEGFSAGDRVATHPSHPCGRCEACRGGLDYLCPHMGHFGINMQGAMAEYFLVRQDRARRIPEQVDFASATLAEPISVCLEALTQARVNSTGSLLIIGDGPFGVLMARLAQRLRLDKVVIAGLQDFRLAFAGNAIKIKIRDVPDPVKMLKAQVGELGYDAAILAVSSRAAFSTCLQCLKPKGRLVVFSALEGATPVDLLSVHLKELEIVGSCNDENRFDEAVSLLTEPALGISDLITQRMVLDNYRQALHLAEYGHDRAMKVSFVFQD
jgi:threonine dehydrogenase-like Zn-dependent dehydrogenase